MKDSVDYQKDCLYHLDVSFAAFKACDFRPDAFLSWFISQFSNSFFSGEANGQRFYWTVMKLYYEFEEKNL